MRLLVDMVAPFIADGRLVRVLDDWSPPISGYHLYYPNRRHPSPAFAALLKELRANSHL
jgi:DNA-binding transcriptional LysR family regulator